MHMTTTAAPFSIKGPSPASAVRLCSVARQPILDLHGRVHAFKLLFRSQALLETAARFSLSKPSELKKLTGALTAFVSCPPEALSQQLEHVLPASLTVLEIDLGLEPSPEQIGLYRNLKHLGFRLALDNFRRQEQPQPLLELADYVQVDFAATTTGERRQLFERLCASPVKLLARNVETQAQYKQAQEEGFTLFEGYFFCQPLLIKNRRPPANQMLRLEILQALQRRPMDLPKVGELVKRDGPLAYQLLRLVNSPLWAVRQRVESIQTALLAVGEDAFRRVATLAIASQFNGDQPQELLCMAMVRGRFCELAGAARNLDPFGQYLLGLLSLLPAMQGQPMSEIALTLPLSPEIREALLGAINEERALLEWLEHHERGDWASCDAAAQAHDLNQENLAKIYIEAVEWAEAALHSAA
jgi:c-di-GMP-related signal transduction protein